MFWWLLVWLVRSIYHPFTYLQARLNRGTPSSLNAQNAFIHLFQYLCNFWLKTGHPVTFLKLQNYFLIARGIFLDDLWNWTFAIKFCLGIIYFLTNFASKLLRKCACKFVYMKKESINQKMQENKPHLTFRNTVYHKLKQKMVFLMHPTTLLLTLLLTLAKKKTYHILSCPNVQISLMEKLKNSLRKPFL